MPSDLIELIRTHAPESAAAGDFDAVAKVLSDPTIVVRDETPVSYARLTETLGDKVRELVAGTVRTIAKSSHPRAGEIADAHTVLLNEQSGLRIDSDERQATIDLLAAAGKWPDTVRDAIKSQGKRMESIAGRTVTADECREAWTAATIDVDAAEKRSIVRLSVNLSHDGVLNAFASVGVVAVSNSGNVIADVSVQNIVNDADLLAALRPLLQKLTEAR